MGYLCDDDRCAPWPRFRFETPEPDGGISGAPHGPALHGVAKLTGMAVPHLDAIPPSPRKHDQNVSDRFVPDGTPGTTVPVGPGFSLSDLKCWFR